MPVFFNYAQNLTVSGINQKKGLNSYKKNIIPLVFIKKLLTFAAQIL
jgi:hypothetical protein